MNRMIFPKINKKWLLSLLCVFVLVGCKRPTWHKTTQGCYVYSIADDGYSTNWEGEVIGCFADGKGDLVTYNKNGKVIDRKTLNTSLGVDSEWSFVPTKYGDYLGEMSGGCPDGFGVLVNNDTIKVGEFNDGYLYNGKVEIYHKTQRSIEPCFRGTLKKGKVIGIAQYYVNGEISFEGGMEKGLRTGVGKEYEGSVLVYDGYYKKGVRHGNGKAYDCNGIIYNGEWKNGKRHGEGISYHGENFVVYSGEWKDDLYNGKGKLYENGMCVEGKFEKGKLTKTISTSVFKQIGRATSMWINGESISGSTNDNEQTLDNYIPESQMEFITQLNGDLNNYLSEQIGYRVEKRFGFWHLFRMLFQPWFRSDVRRADFAQNYICKKVTANDLQNYINAKVDYYNRNTYGEQMHPVKIEKIPDGVIVDTNTAIKIFDREAMETTDVLAGWLIDVLFCFVIAFIIGLIIGIFAPYLIPYVGVVDTIMLLISIGVGLYVSVFRTTAISIELEQEITKMVADNYMLFLDSQNIVSQLLGLM